MSDLVNILTQTLATKPGGEADKEIFFSGDDKFVNACIIGNINDNNSLQAMRKCRQSIIDTKSTLNTYIMDSVTPETLDTALESMGHKLKDWVYPHEGETKKITLKRPSTGFFDMILTGYKSSDYRKVVACLASHMKLWHMCAATKEPLVILEHDAMFTRTFDWMKFLESRSDLTESSIVGLNNPLGATRRANLYYDKVVAQANKKEYVNLIDVPSIDDERIPQGLPGNSAYIIFPEAAQTLLKNLENWGLWPNDAIMCKQLMSGMKIAYPFYTKVQGLRSTTTL